MTREPLRSRPAFLRDLMKTLGLLIVGHSLLLTGCGLGEPPGDQTVRLLANREGVQAQWPNPARPIPESLHKSRIGSTLPYPGRTARVVLHRDEGELDGRSALLAPSGSRQSFEVTVTGRRPALDVALGYHQEEPQEDLTLHFEIQLEDSEGNLHSLLAEDVVLQEKGPWLDRRLPLERWRDESVTLHFQVEGPDDPGLWAAWGVPEIVDEAAQAQEPNLILIVLDTLRADHLGSYGYPRPTSPFLDRWGKSATRFELAISQSSWTRPSHRSMFSGLYPTSRAGLTSPPLAEMLWRAGYRTSALTGGAQLAYRFGFSRGFEVHRIERWIRKVDRVVDELERNRGRKHFLFLHTYEIHDPYEHRELAQGLDPGRVGEVFRRATLETHGRQLTPEEQEYVVALYDSGILYADRQLETLFTELESRGLLENSIVVVTSDHGEEFWDHGGWGHGHAMYDHQTHVPLFVHLPASFAAARGLEPAQGRVVRQQVRLVDLYPTLLELLDIPLEHRVQGRSLVPLLAGERLPSADALSETTYWGAYEFKTLRNEHYKYLTAMPKKAETNKPGWATLFDLRKDPAETQDIATEKPEVFERMESLMEILLIDGEIPEEAIPKDLDPELEKQLRALGYIGG